MVEKKEFRNLTVSDFYRRENRVPMIMVNRLWLEELEINFGNCVRIKLGNGQLIIGSNEEKHKNSMLKSFDGKNKRRDFRRKR